MDSYDNIKIEKAKAMHRYRTFQKFATIVRTLEIFIVVGIICWSLFRSSEFLTPAFEFSCACLWRLRGLLFSPHFVFLLGNAIIVALFANSREKASSSAAGDFVSSGQAYTGVVYSGESIVADKSGAGQWRVEEREPEVPPPTETETVAIEFPKKIENVVEKMEDEEKKIYRRSKSTVEKAMVIREEEVKEKEKEKIELRRSKTVPRRKSKKEEETMAGRRRRMSDVDDLSNEEFRRRVEAFIEKQQKFLREESSKAIVLTH